MYHYFIFSRSDKKCALIKLALMDVTTVLSFPRADETTTEIGVTRVTCVVSQQGRSYELFSPKGGSNMYSYAFTTEAVGAKAKIYTTAQLKFVVDSFWEINYR